MISYRSLISSWLVFSLISVIVLLYGVVDVINGNYGHVFADIVLYIYYLILIAAAWYIFPDHDTFPPPTSAPAAQRVQQVNKQDKAA